MATNAKGDFILEIPHTRAGTKFEEERAMRDAHRERAWGKANRAEEKAGGLFSGWAGGRAAVNEREATASKLEAKGLRSYLRYLDKDDDD